MLSSNIFYYYFINLLRMIILAFMKYQNRKEEIIKKSALLFKEKGYSAVTMRDIAQAMGIKAASLYNHIKSKQEILSIVIMSIAKDFTTGMNAISESNMSNVKKLEEIIALHINITIDNPNGMAALNADWMHLEETLELYLKLRDDYENRFRDILNNGALSQEIKDVNIDVMLFSILSTLRSLYLWIPKKEQVNPVTLASDLSKVLLKGIAK